MFKDNMEIPIMKIIGLFSENDEMSEEKKAFKELAKHYAQFMDLKFYFVNILLLNQIFQSTNEVIIDQAFDKYGTLWFPELERSTILIIGRNLELQKYEATNNLEKLVDTIHL